MLRLAVAVALFAAQLFGCSKDSAPALSVFDEENAWRADAEGSLPVVVAGNNDFAFDLYSRLKEREGNILFSPAGISSVLAMVFDGAEGATREQMATCLHFRLPSEKLNVAFRLLAEKLRDTGDSPGYGLQIANRLWSQEGQTFPTRFTKTVSADFGASIGLVDFGRPTEASHLINTWVQRQSHGKIAEMVAADDLNILTRLVLTNATYFTGSWDERFSLDATRDAPFKREPDKQVTIPMMRQKAEFLHVATDGLQIIELPYLGNRASLLVLLPDATEGLSALEDMLSRDRLVSWTEGLALKEIVLYLPRFTVTERAELSGVLKDLGMTSAFDPQEADFSGMGTQHDLYLSAIAQRAFIDVNEVGTEAAAASGITVLELSKAAEKTPVFRADHPFVFMLRKNSTGSILFLGRVVNPLQSSSSGP